MMEEEAAAPPQDHLVAMDVDGGIVVVESCDAKDHQGSSMHGSFQQEEEGRSGPVTAAADPETSTFPSSATQETKKTLSTATACGRGGAGAGAGAAGGGEEAGEDYEASGSRDDGQLLEVFNNNKKQRKRSSDSLAASDSASLGGGGGGGLDGEAAAASHQHVCRQCKREFSSGRALGGHMRAHGSLAMEDGNARVTWNNSSETVVAAAVASDKELQQQLTSSSSWRARGTSYLVNPASDLDSCRDESSPSLASSRPLRPGTHSCSRSEEAGRVRKRGRVSSSAADAAAELVGRCQEPEEDQDHEEEEATSVLLGSSSSSEATGNSKMQQAEEFDVTEGTSYMCQICEEEFETARDLKLHKKEHPQYILRMNPKRSQKFLDQDSSDLLLAATAGATGQSTHHHQPKKAALSSGMGTTEESKLPISCTECEKKFGSMKALFGHMRCHPEREWRGIQPPPDRSTAAAGHAANHGSSRKKRRPPPTVVPIPTADPESESETETDSKPPAAAAGKLGSDLDSDTESIEAAYINGSSRQSSGPPGWRTKKRTKRTKQTVRSLQAVVTGGGGAAAAAAAAPEEEEEEEEPGPSSSSTPTETQVHKDIVFALMLLRPKRVAQLSHPPSLEQQQCKQEGSGSMNVAEKFKAPNVDNYKSTDCHDTHKQHQHQQYHRDPDDSKGKRHVEDAAEDAALISDGQDFDEMETGEQRGGMRMMYQCATCKRIFKSHQALGGHRASHKKVKGCFARTSVNDEEGFGRQQDQSTEDNNKEDIPDEDFLKAEEQLLLPHEPQEPSHHSEEDAELPCDYLTVARGDNEEMLNAVRKSKGHECSICHRIFNSGQALGGHKRCHWGGGTGTAGPNEATTTVHNLNNNNAVVMVNGDQPGLQEYHPIQGLPVPGGQQNKGMQEGIIDLNMPAPECVEEIVEEQIASASASGMAPPIDHHHPSYLPFPTFTTDSPAFIIQQPCSNPVEKCTQQQHIKFLGESMDTKVDKSLEPIASNGATDAGGDFRTRDAADQGMDWGMKSTDAVGDFRTGDAADQGMDRGMKGTDAVGDFRTGDAADQAMDQGMKGTDAVGDFGTGDAADQAMDQAMKGTDAVGDFRTGDAADQGMDQGMKGTDAVGDFRTGDAADQAMDQAMKGTDAVGDFRIGGAADQGMDQGMKGTDAVGDFRTGDAADQVMDQGMKGTELQHMKSCWGDSLDTKVDQSLEPITSVGTTDAVGFRTGDADAMDRGMNNFSNTCDQGFTSLEHLSSHQNTHAAIMGPAPSLTA